MRITNKIIQNNSINNINVNKELQDSLSTMIASRKKISRPSEDPIIALRSLSLRTSVNQTTQYVEKNVQDANSWLKVTEDAITTLSDVIVDIRKLYVKGTQDTLTASDRKIITDNLESLAAEIYNTGNVDFAGRSVFTGFRTDSTLVFQKDEALNYRIDENMDSVKVDEITFVNKDDDELKVYTKNLTRVRLSYNKLADGSTDASKLPTGSITVNGQAIDIASNLEVKKLADDPYKYSSEDAKNKIVYIPETGELLIGEEVGVPDGSGGTVLANKETIEGIQVSYTKDTWDKGDLRPEHYFTCQDMTDPTHVIDYTSPAKDGQIEYNIGVNQSIRINTTADECFSHNIVRDLQDVMNALSEVNDIEEKIASIEKEIKGYDETQTAAIENAQARLESAKKSQTFINEKLHSLFSNCITYADKYLEDNNVALTNCGTRSKRLDLIENRLDTQLSTLKELKSENEDADIAETAIRLKSAEYAYDAALMSTAKIIKESLLNYV